MNRRRTTFDHFHPPSPYPFRAYRAGEVTLAVLAVDKNTLLMKTKVFDLNVQ
jgi:hypothetical protein